MTHWANDSGHVWSVGRTQTGKTTTALEAFAENERVNIWLNARGEDRVEGVKARADGSYKSLQGVKNAFARNETRIEYLPADRQEGIVQLKNWLFKVAERTDRELPITIFLDEVHEVAPQSGKQYGNFPARDAVRDLAKRGEKRNLKVWGISQDPVAFDKESLRQRTYLLCFELAHEQANYLADYGVRVDEVNAQPEFAGIVYHAKGQTVAEGVKARAEYA
jgi:hypothetical protein